MVDDIQDFQPLHYRLLNLIFQTNPTSLTIFGDDDQAIARKGSVVSS